MRRRRVNPARAMALALESGMRKGELSGVRWSDIDLEAGTLKVMRTLLQPKDKQGKPVFGPTKTRAPRSINLSAETVQLLREHRRAQATLELKNRTVYRDHG